MICLIYFWPQLEMKELFHYRIRWQKNRRIWVLQINNYVLVDIGLNLLGRKIKKGISSITGSSITLTNNETKEIVKGIKSLEKKKNFNKKLS